MANIKLNFSTSVDLAGLNQLQAKLNEIRTMASSREFSNISGLNPVQIQKTIDTVNTLENALRSAYDVKLNTVNIQSFNRYLQTSGLNVQELYKNLVQIGPAGQQAFLSATKTLFTMGESVKKTNKLVETMSQTFKNTITWGISSGLWNTMLSSTQKAYHYVIDLDKSLNDIRVVTGKSANEMSRFAKEANRAAKELAVSTKEYTEGALIYYQQGLDDKTVKTLTDITAKASNVTGQSMETVSEQLTAVWNGYQVANQAAKEGMGVYEEYVDKMAAVGAATAADLEELATAMSKVASAANSMGVGFDELSAQIATIVSVTRQAPESVGTALKTIYARMGDLQIDGVDEFGVSLGTVSGQLKTMGVDVMDANGQMRDMDEVMTEVAGKWHTWTDAQKEAAAVAMAGKRQYNNLIALFDGWDMYEDTLKTSMEAAGTLNEQQNTALESLDSKMNKMTAAAEKFYDALFDEKSIGGLVDGLTEIVDMVGSLTTGLGGLKGILPIVGSLMLKTFSSSIGTSLTNSITNIQTRNAEMSNIDARQKLVQQLGEAKTQYLQDNPFASKVQAEESHKTLEFYKSVQEYEVSMDKATKDRLQTLLTEQAELSQKTIELDNQINAIEEEDGLLNKVKEAYNAINTIQEDSSLNQDEKNQKIDEEIQKVKDLINSYATLSSNMNLDYVGLAGKSGAGYKSSITKAQNQILNAETSYNSIDAIGQQTTTSSTLLQDLQGIDATFTTEAFKEIITSSTSAEEALKKLGSALGDDFKKNGDLCSQVTNILNQNFQKMSTTNDKVTQQFKSKLAAALKCIQMPTKKVNAEVEKYSNVFNQALKETRNLDIAMDRVTKAMKEEGAASAEVVNGLLNIQAASEGAEQQQKQFKEALDLEKGLTGLTSTIGAFTQILSGIGALFNSFTTAMDSTLEPTERIKAAFSGIVMAIPLIVGGFASLVSVTKTLTGAETMQAAVIALLNGELLTKLSLTTAEIAKTIAVVMVKKLETAGRMGNVAAMLAEAAAAGSLSAALGLLSVYILPIIAAIAALAGVCMLVAGAMENYQKSLENQTKELEKDSEAAKKHTEQMQAEKDAIDAIVSGYKDLLKQEQDGQISKEQLRSKTYDLCLEYGREDLALQALIADYEELNNIMNKAQYDKTSDLADAAASEQNKLVKTIASRMFSSADESARDYRTIDGQEVQTFDIVDGIFADANDNKLKEILEKYITDENAFVDGHVTGEALAKALAENPDMLSEIAAIQGSDSATNIVKAADSSSEDFKRYTEAENIYDVNKKSTLVSDHASNVNSVQEYGEAVKKLTSEAVKEGLYDSAEEATAWAESAVGQNLADGNEHLYADYDLTKKVSNETGKSLEDIATQIEGFSEGEKSYLRLNIDAIEAETDLEEFLKKAEHQIVALNANEEATTIRAMVEVEGKTEFSQAEIDSLFNMDGFTEAIGKTKDEFKNMDFGAQREAAVQYYSQLQETIKTDAAKGLEAAKAEVEAAEAAYQEVLGKSISLGDIKDEIFKNWNIELTDSMFAAAESYVTDGQWTEDVAHLYATINEQFYKITGQALSMDDFLKTTQRMTTSYANKQTTDAEIADKKGARDAAANTYNKLLKVRNEGLRDLDLSYKKLAKHYDDEFDRFYKINKELEKYNDNLEDLSRIQNHLSGQSLVDNLKAQGQELQKQAASYETLLKQQQAYAGELAGELAGGFGVQFSADGTITNYKDVTDKMLAWVNARGDQEADVERYEKFKEKLDQYDSLHQEMIQTANDIDNSYLEAVSANLEAWEVEIELQLDTKEAEREMLDFVHETSDNFKKAFSDIGAELSHILATSGTYTQENGTIATDIQAINDVIAEIDKIEQMGDSYFTSEGAMFGSMSEAKAKLKELQSTLLDDAKEVHQAWQDGWDAYMEGIDQANEKYEKFNEQYERINEELEYQGQLIELLYGPEAYALQGSLLTQQLNTSKSQIEFTKEQVDLWQSMYDQAEEGSEEQLKYAELLQESQSKLNDLTLAHIQLIKDEYANTVSSIIKNLENEMTNNLGFDKMREEWERALEESEKYYDSVEKIYQIDSLQNKYQNAINNTSSTKYQQAISDMMADQLSMLEEKEKMTEYDVQLAEKHLSILEAEAALEDAQNAKNAMKLVRGADGNWGYQYVADTKDVEQKQQNLQDAYNDLYTFTKKAQQDAMTSLMDAKEQYLEDLQEIYMQEGISAEEKEIQAQALYEQYYGAGGTITLLNQEYEQKRKDAAYSTVTALTGYYKTDEDAYRQMDANERDLVDKFATDTGATYAKLYADIKLAYENDQTELETKLSENWETWEKTANDMSAKWNSDDEDSIKTQVKTALGDLKSATEDYEKKVDEVANLVGQDFNSEEGLTGDIGAAEQKVKDLEKATDNLDDNVKTDLENFKGYVEKLEDAWEFVLEDVNAVGLAIDGVQMKLDKLPPNKTVTVTYKEVHSGGSEGGGDTSGGGYEEYPLDDGAAPPPATKPESSKSLFAVNDKVDSKERVSGEGNGFVRAWQKNAFSGQMVTSPVTGVLASWFSGGRKIEAMEDYQGETYYKIPDFWEQNRWFKESQLTHMQKFDTGGYTGEWDSSGRMAMLHQKEIVLNAKDTENLLATVDTVRDMANVSSSIGSAIMQNVRTMIFEALGIRAGTVYGNGGSNNETSNVFNITAEFPNADSVATIQEAILSLPNLASQYLAENRK